MYLFRAEKVIKIYSRVALTKLNDSIYSAENNKSKQPLKSAENNQNFNKSLRNLHVISGNMLDNFDNYYHRISKIGEGSFSEVLKVKNKETGELFAAKRLTNPFTSLAEIDNYTELRTLKKLEFHPNVLHLVDYVYEKCELTLIFNLMDMSLYDYIKDRKRKLPESRCKNYVYQLLNGISYLHQNGIFHRDIKPENILIRIDATLKKTNPMKAELIQLGDLGSVSFTSFPLPRSEYVSTRWYRSPECLLTSGYYGPKMDIWALGCCFYEMLTLDALFPGENELDQLHKIHEILGSPTQQMLHRFKNLNLHVEFPKKNPVCFYKLVPKLSHYGVDALKKMLMYHPDNRLKASSLLDHLYFEDLKSRMPLNSLNNRLIYSTRSDNMPSLVKSRGRGSTKGSNLSCSTSDSLQSQIFVEAAEKNVKKTLEQCWNMSNSAMKTRTLSNIRVSKSNQKKALSCNSSINSIYNRK